MMFRLIAPDWAVNSGAITKKTLEGQFSEAALRSFNDQGYNVYYFVHQPDSMEGTTYVNGSRITKFEWVFVDMDLKDGVFETKADFLELVDALGIPPTKVVDSGNGMHVYWKISNLDAMSYLRFQRRLARLYQTDEAVSKICQLMRYPGTFNTKKQPYVSCTLLSESEQTYTAEEFDKLLPTITQEDEFFCKQHYNTTYNPDESLPFVSDKLPEKFGKLLKSNAEAKELWVGPTDDRSMNDWRLGQLMQASGFTRDEAMSVLSQTSKALKRAPVHRISYAKTIVDKLWTYEENPDDEFVDLSASVKDILKKTEDAPKGLKFPCHPMVDSTVRGFRLGDVLGLVAGSGVGKTAFTMNIFRWFAERNPEYHHFFVPLEQPAHEIAERWMNICGNDTSLQDKVHIMSNYDDDGNFRHLSLYEIKEYVKKFQEKKKCKIGCVVIDHIGALKKRGKEDESQGIVDICHEMKAFAIETNTFLIMQSQTSREKAGIGDLELDKDAAYGTMYFEAYCDFLVTLWQPLKRMHSQPACPTVTAFKFCKIRFKKPQDVIQEDVPYYSYFDAETETIRELTQDQKTSFGYFLPKATNKRNLDRKTAIVEYKSVGKNEPDVRNNPVRKSHN